MKRQELIDSLYEIKDMYAIDREIYDQYGKPYPYHFNKDYSAEKDPRLEEFLSYRSPNETETRDDVERFAFAVVNCMAKYMNKAYDEDIMEMMRITGYTAEEMNKFFRRETTLLPDYISTNDVKCQSFILIKAMIDAMLDPSEWNGYSKGKLKGERRKNPALERLNALIDYMEEKVIYDLGDRSEKEYEEFVIRHALCFCSNSALIEECNNMQSILNEKYSKTIKEVRKACKKISEGKKPQQKKAQAFNVLNYQADKFPSISPDLKTSASPIMCMPRVNSASSKKDASGYLELKNKLDLEDREQAKTRAVINSKLEDLYKEIKERNREIYKKDNTDLIADSFLSALLSRDEVWKTVTGGTALHAFVALCNIPEPTAWDPKLSDTKKWHAHTLNDTETLEEIAEPILTKDQYILKSVGKGNYLPLARSVSSVISRIGKYPAPETLYIRKSVVNFFTKNGFSEQQARDFAVITATLEGVLYMGKYSEKDSFSYPEEEKEPEPDPEAAALLEKTLAEKNTAEKELAAARKEIRSLDHEISKLKKEIERLKQAEPAEDIDFTEEEQIEEEQKERQEIITFPYRTDMKIVVYGGFEKFHKRLQEYLPEVRIVEATAHVDVNPVRNADIVFLQTNRTDHSNYYLVLDTCKASNVPYVYLNYASAEKCAEVIVNEIEKMRAELPATADQG